VRIEAFGGRRTERLRGQPRHVRRCHPACRQAPVNALRRSRADRWLGGVCGGIARVTGVESWIWRLLFAWLALCAGTGVLVYLLMWILIPADPVIPGLAPGHPHAG